MILREYLVKLGYQVDANTERRMNESLEKTAKGLVQLATAIEGAAAAMTVALVKMADGLEQFYYSSRRTGATVESLKAIGYAASQMGSSAGAAQQSIENLARFLRSSPGASKMLNGLGIATDGRGADQILTDFAARTRTMPYYRALAYANVLGIDERTLMAAREGLDQFDGEYRRMLRSAGVNADQAAKAGHGFMVQVRSLWAAIGVLGDKIAVTFLGPVGKQVAKLRDLLVANFGKIAATITSVGSDVLVAAEVITRVLLRVGEAAGDVIGWFNGLDHHTKQVLETVAAFAAAWKLLNLGFLASPIGIVLSLGAGLLLLYDDYKTWQAGGKSLIDWSKWGPEVEKAWNTFKVWIGWLDQVTLHITGEGGLHRALEGLLAYTAGSWLLGMRSAFGALARFPALAAITAGITAGMALDKNSWFVDHVVNPVRTSVGLDPILAVGSDLAPETDVMKLTPREAGLNKIQSWSFWKSQGLTDAQAAGMLAQEQNESGFDPNAVGDNGTAGGSFQWHKPRRDAMLAATGIDVWHANHLDQLKASLWEFLHGGEQKAGRELMAAQTATSAGYAATDYTRPHDRHEWVARAALADNYNPVLLNELSKSGANVQITQHNTTTVNGATDPHQTATTIQQVGRNNSADLLRNTQAAVR